jgi:molybdopterin synthase catalytic subunit
MKIQIQEEDFDVSKELELLRVDLPQIGGINVFVGTVRDEHFGQKIEGMVLEHYPGMAEKSLANILDQAQARWQILNATVIHRVGDLRPGEQIVLVAVASSHRGDAFAACEFIMDYLKTSAPFWKKELTPNGAHWVDARITDDERLKKWQI